MSELLWARQLSIDMSVNLVSNASVTVKRIRI